MAIPTRTENNEVVWPIEFRVELFGGLQLNLGIFKVSAMVSFAVTASIRFPDISGDGFITFAEIYWLVKANNGNVWAALEKKLTLEASFTLDIGLCLWLPFKVRCWTIYKHTWKFWGWEKIWKVPCPTLPYPTLPPQHLHQHQHQHLRPRISDR